jgi:hypothetical protein
MKVVTLLLGAEYPLILAWAPAFLEPPKHRRNDGTTLCDHFCEPRTGSKHIFQRNSSDSTSATFLNNFALILASPAGVNAGSADEIHEQIPTAPQPLS